LSQLHKHFSRMLKSLQVKHIKTPNKKRKIESKITD
jgi:hypothetical protein